MQIHISTVVKQATKMLRLYNQDTYKNMCWYKPHIWKLIGITLFTVYGFDFFKCCVLSNKNVE